MCSKCLPENQRKKLKQSLEKKRKTKRLANSPFNLDDTGRSDKSESVSNGQRTGNNSNNRNNGWNVINGANMNDLNQCYNSSTASNSNSNSCGSVAYFPNMSFSQPSFGGFSFGNQGNYPTATASPTMPSMPPSDDG